MPKTDGRLGITPRLALTPRCLTTRSTVLSRLNGALTTPLQTPLFPDNIWYKTSRKLSGHQIHHDELKKKQLLILGFITNLFRPVSNGHHNKTSLSIIFRCHSGRADLTHVSLLVLMLRPGIFYSKPNIQSSLQLRHHCLVRDL